MRTMIVALTLGLLSTPLLAVNKDAAEFGGSCAWGMAEYGAVVPTDCSVSWTDPKTKKTLLLQLGEVEAVVPPESGRQRAPGRRKGPQAAKDAVSSCFRAQ